MLIAVWESSNLDIALLGLALVAYIASTTKDNIRIVCDDEHVKSFFSASPRVTSLSLPRDASTWTSSKDWILMFGSNSYVSSSDTVLAVINYAVELEHLLQLAGLGWHNITGLLNGNHKKFSNAMLKKCTDSGIRFQNFPALDELTANSLFQTRIAPEDLLSSDLKLGIGKNRVIHYWLNQYKALFDYLFSDRIPTVQK